VLLSIDVEDRHQIHRRRTSMAEGVSPEVLDDLLKVLDLLAETGSRATFFVVGMLARARPDLVPRILEGGHELGVHGMTHERVDSLGPDELRRELREARALLEDQAGQPVEAFRAPEFSITRSEGWALDMLAEEGFRLDSSVIPLRHVRYGDPGAPRHVHEVRPGLWEVPVSVATVGRRTIPFAGGGFFRLWPLWVSARLAERVDPEARPLVYYFHPYDFAARRLDLPMEGLDARTRRSFALVNFKQSLFNGRTAPRLRRMLTREPALPLSAALAGKTPQPE